jgi:hypothetical protein
VDERTKGQLLLHHKTIRRWRCPWTEWCFCGVRWDRCQDAMQAAAAARDAQEAG